MLPRVRRAIAATCGRHSAIDRQDDSCSMPQPPTGTQLQPEAEDEGEDRRDDEVRDGDAGHRQTHDRVVDARILAERRRRCRGEAYSARATSMASDAQHERRREAARRSVPATRESPCTGKTARSRRGQPPSR